MGRASPRKVHRYNLEFKRQAVRLSQLEGVEVQAVADALDSIHPFMLLRVTPKLTSRVQRERSCLWAGAIELPWACGYPGRSRYCRTRTIV